MFQRRTWVCALAVSALLAGCRGSGERKCKDLIDQARYEEAARVCAEAYVREGSDRAGASTVLAHYSLGQSTQVLTWVERLARDGKVRPGVWGLAAAVHLSQGQWDAAEREYRSDLALYDATGDHERAADTLNRLSDLSWQRSRYREAFLFSSRALEEALQSGKPDLESASEEGLYTVLYAVGDLEGARQVLERSSGERRTAPSPAGFLLNRGIVLADEGRLALARRDLEQALAAGSGRSEPSFFRSAHLNLANVFLRLREPEKAAVEVEKAAGFVEPGAAPPVSLSYYRARVSLARGKPEEALKVAAAALAAGPPPDWAWDLELQRGRAEEALGHNGAAEEAYHRSIAIVEEMRRSLAFDELKTWLLDRKREPFEALFRLQARAGRAKDALATAERSLARTLLDAFLQAHAGPHPGPSARTAWSQEVAASRIGDLEQLLPLMSESPVAVPQPLDRVLASFGRRHGRVYFEAGDDLWLITIAGGDVRLRRLDRPAPVVREMAEQLLAHPDGREPADRLGDVLFPKGSLPAPGETVHVVAEGSLGNLPFAALRTGGRYLVEDHAVCLLPSLSALAALESQPVKSGGVPVVLADPGGNLPAAAAEGRAVARLLQGSLRTGAAATSTALAAAARSPLLHLATHTGLSTRGAWLLLADRRLRPAEVISRRVGPRLVVLASCASGARPGRQMWGSMGAAFLAAGSRSVVASLWSVEDRGARDFVVRFYQQGGATDPAGGVARAQRVAIHQGLSPNDWAPFTLLGSDRPLGEIR